MLAAGGVAGAWQTQQPAPILAGTVAVDWSWEPAVVPSPPVAIVPPENLRMVVPSYPTRDAIRLGYRGHVIVEATISAAGEVTDLRVLRSLADGALDQATTEALRRWSFRPASLDGAPIAVTGIFTVRFGIATRAQPRPAAGNARDGAVPMGSGGLVPPVLLRTVLPEYPSGAEGAGIRGDVYIEAVVTRGGAVVEPLVIRGLPDDELNRRALQAVGNWEFEPGRIDDEPVDVLALFTVTFRGR